MAVPGACIKYTQNIAHFDQGSYLTTFPAICKKFKEVLWWGVVFDFLSYLFLTDDDVQVTYLIEVLEQCTQCTL